MLSPFENMPGGGGGGGGEVGIHFRSSLTLD